MPNPVYRIEQAIFWPIIIVGITLESYQIYLAKKHNVVKSKLIIHSAFCLELITWFPHLIDPWGVNKISTVFVDLIFSDFTAWFSIIGFVFVIYSHFQVHYLALKKPLPPSMLHMFGALVVFHGLSLLFTDILVYGANVSAVRIWWVLSPAFVTLALFFLDFIGFILLYRLMKEMIANQDLPNMPHGGDDKFQILMGRLKKFHGIMIPVLLLLILILFWAAGSGWVNPAPRTPDEYRPPGSGLFCLMVYFPLTWWSWISASSPHGSAHEKSNSKATTKISSVKTAHLPDDIEPTPLQLHRPNSNSVGGEDEPMLASSSSPSGAVPSVLQSASSGLEIVEEVGQPSSSSSSKYIFNPHLGFDSPSKMQESRIEHESAQDKV